MVRNEQWLLSLVVLACCPLSGTAQGTLTLGSWRQGRGRRPQKPGSQAQDRQA